MSLKWGGFLVFLFRLLWHIQSRPWPQNYHIFCSFLVFVFSNRLHSHTAQSDPSHGQKQVDFLGQEDFPFLSCPVHLRPVGVLGPLT